MKFEFNEDGSLKLPKQIEESKEYSKKQLEEAKKNPDKVIVRYEKISDYEDNWIITLPKSIPESILSKLKKWTDNYHRLIRGSASIDKSENNEFILIVRGYSLRCTWAHAFLNGLNTALIKDYKTTIKQTKTCEHKFHVKD